MIPNFLLAAARDVTPFDPDSRGNQISWFKFNTGITASGGDSGLVSEWTDSFSSGKGVALTQNTETNKPTLASGIITFDGVDNYMNTSSFAAVSQPITLYMLSKQISWTLNRTFFCGLGFSEPQLYQGNSPSPNISVYGGTTDDCENGDMTLGSFFAICAVFNGASSLLQVGSGGTPVSASGNPGAGTLTGITLAALAFPTLYTNMAYKEFFLYANADNASERAQALAYLESL